MAKVNIFDFEYALNSVWWVDSSSFGVVLGWGAAPDPRNAPKEELSKFLSSVEPYLFRELVGRVITAMSGDRRSASVFGDPVASYLSLPCRFLHQSSPFQESRPK